MIIKDWFLTKNFNEGQIYAISVSDISVVKETEKAYLLRFESDFGCFTSWVPKVCVMTYEEYDRERKIKEKAFENAMEKYEKLLNWAKEQGVKVRARMKKTTILSAINKAGLVVPPELI